MSQKRKKQHYVAQSILERFTTDGEKIFVYDKLSGKSFPANKRDIAQEKYFYDLPDEMIPQDFKDAGVDAQIMERILGRIDGSFNQAIAETIKLPKNKSLTEELKEQLALGIVFQVLRTKDFRDLIIEGYTKARQAISDDLVKQHFPDASKDHYPKVSLKEGHESILHNQHILNPPFVAAFVEELFKRIWILGVNRTVQVFYTSDNPVVKHNHLKRPLEAV